MRTIDAAKKDMRNDFMVGNGKGDGKDMLVRQRPGLRQKLSHEDITTLYANNRIVQNIIDIPAEDMTRSWFTLRMEDEKLRNDIMSRLADLNAKEAFKKMRQYERLRGDGFISLGVTQSVPINLNTEMKMDTLKKIDYLHAFSSMKMVDFLVNEDMFSENFGDVVRFKIKRRSNSGIIVPGIDETIVHASRLIHDQTRRLEDAERGQSLLEPMYDIIKVLDTSLWSVGQILYDYTFKIYKSEGIDDLNKEDRKELSMLMDFMFRTEALAIIGKDEELKKESTNTAGMKDLLDYVWDYLAGAARMPKTVIKGQEAGTIAGAQYDVMNYYSRITAHQENEQKPQLEQLIRMLLWAENEPGGKIDPDSLEWEIKYNPLWSVDAKTDAEIRKLTAETDAIYIVNGVHTADDVREARFGQFGLSEELKFSGDSADLEKMAKDVYSAWKERGSNG
jgi:phage-related protein (TIGR01555 family)